MKPSRPFPVARGTFAALDAPTSASSRSRSRRLTSMLVGTTLLLATLVATSPASAAAPPASEQWPPCDDVTTTWCIETFEVDGVDVRTASDWKLDVYLLDSDNGVNSVNWYLGNRGPDAAWNESPPASAIGSKIEVALNTGDLVPRFTIGYGTGGSDGPFSLHTGGDAASGYTLHAVGYPIEIEWRVADQSCFGGECGDDTTAADVSTLAFGGNTQDMATWGEEYIEQFDGMWIVTDAQYHSEPIFEIYPEPHWVVQMGNPHLGVDGVTPQVGEFIARVGPGMLENVGTTAAEAIDAGLVTRRVQGDTVVEVPSTVSDSLDELGNPDGGVILHITDFPYSVATIEVGGAVAEDEPSLTRLAGTDRILTGIAVSQQRFPGADTAQAAVLARSDLFPDALAGTPLAVQNEGPLLLTPSKELDAPVLDELDRVLPPGATVYLLGGESALSDAVADAVTIAGFEAIRLHGATRYATAAEIGKLLAEGTGRIYLATGRNFPDALSAGAAAAATDGIVLLTDDTTLPDEAKQVIALYASDTERIAVGAQAAAADPGATSLAGKDRYDTAVRLARHAFAEPPTVFGLASGVNFPDGLTGGAHVGALGGPLVLVAPDQVPAPASSYLDEVLTLRTGFVYGGDKAVWPAVFTTVEQVLLGR